MPGPWWYRRITKDYEDLVNELANAAAPEIAGLPNPADAPAVANKIQEVIDERKTAHNI